jgi:hypothetical protein
MDLDLYFRVLWRFRALIGAGVVLAALVAIFAFGTPAVESSRLTLAPHDPTTYASEGVLLVTQPGFPWGRSTPPEQEQTAYPEPNRLTNLAMLYAELAKGDAVRALMASSSDGGLEVSPGAIDVRPRVAADNANLLPMLTVTAETTSPQASEQLARETINALRQYLADEQEAAGIAFSKRVQIDVVRRPNDAFIIDEASRVGPAFLFLLILMATVALAFVLENLKPGPGSAAGKPSRRREELRTQSAR